MKAILLFNLLLPLNMNAAESETTVAADLAPVLAKTEGVVKVLVPAVKVGELKKELQTTINGKVYEIIDGVPGMKIPNGAVLQTLGESKAQVIMENGNSFFAGKGTEMAMNWAKDVKGKMALDLNVKSGLVRGIVGVKDDLNVNLVTSSFKAVMKNAEFISGAIENGNVASTAKGAMLKMIHGDSKLQQLTKLVNGKGRIDAKEIIAQAGSDLVMGVKDLKAVPFLQNDILKQATSISATVESLKNASAKDWLNQLVVSADSIANQVGQQPEPPPDNCGCPSLEERLKRAALKKVRSQIVSAVKKTDNSGGSNGDSKSKENAAAPVGKIDSAGTTAANNTTSGTAPEKGILDDLDPITELSCMSPVLSQLKGAAQIIKNLKDGIFSTKEAKQGDCVSNNSLFKSLTDSRSALKFPNGDEIFSSDNTDILMKWTKKKLDLKVDQGTIRGLFKKVPNRLVNMQAKGLNVSTKLGDMQLSVPNPAAAQLATAAAVAGAAPALAGAASSLLGSAISVFSGLASAGGQLLSEGTQLAAGQSKPRKLTSEEISQLQSQTSMPSQSISSNTTPNTTATGGAAASAAVSSTVGTAPASVPAGAGQPIADPNQKSATSAVASTVGNAIATAAGNVGTALAGAAGTASVAGSAAPTAILPGSSPVSNVAEAAKAAGQSTGPLNDAIKNTGHEKIAPVDNGLWKPSSEQPEEDFVKKYLNF